MRKRIVPGHATLRILGLPLAVAALAAGASCSSSSTPPPSQIAHGCSINSDCAGKLICAFGSCHEQCMTSKDCNGATCLPPSDVCELPQETRCSGTLPCVTGLTCADDVCRAPCTPGEANGKSGGCLGTQTCTEISKEHVCVDSASDGGTSSRDAGGRDSSSDAHGGASDAHGGASDAESDGSKREGGSGTDGSFMSNPDAGPLGFTPSNVDLASVDAGTLAGDGGLLAKAVDVTVSGGDYCSSTSCDGNSPPAPVTITMSNGTFADLFILNSLTVPETASVTFNNTNPVILLVLTTVSIQGAIYVNDGNAGGFSGSAPGPGAGQGGNGFPGSGGAGGSYCGTGGQGATPTPPAPAGGPTYGTADLSPLIAGSAGAPATNGGGPGGGAIEIVAGKTITIGPYASINAGGAGANGIRGGGSGGAILLEAPSVIIEGVLAANGGGGGGNSGAGANGNPSEVAAPGGIDVSVDGGGTASGGKGSAGTTLNGGNGGPPDGPGDDPGSGGGGAGRIRINTTTGVATLMTGSVISPAMGTACMTQGMLTP
jgi:hypothetical protein